jgi:quercetin dioxygenase-like cupin family protein
MGMSLPGATAIGLLGLAVALWAQAPAPQQEGRPKVKVVSLDSQGSSYLVLLQGPPETGSLRSGLVTLEPGTSVGLHNTGENEEMLVPLEGEGELRITGQPPIALRPGLVTYAPPHTEHDVVNTGQGRLRYIFIVARVP